MTDPTRANAVVNEVHPKLAKVFLIGEERELLCHYRKTALLSFDGQNVRERTPVAVGDQVEVTVLGSKDGIIEKVLPRTNMLVRPSPGNEQNRVHVLMANVDLLVIVSSFAHPDFSAGVVDRFLIAAQAAGIEALICINKADLRAEATLEIRALIEYYQSVLKIPCIETITSQPETLQPLIERTENYTVGFCGHSGVGKTSLLNGLLGRDAAKVGDVNSYTGKGKHTTSSAKMWRRTGQSFIIDTPGVKSFGLHGIGSDELIHYYPDLKEFGCWERNCHHLDAEDGDCLAFQNPRIESYRRIYESLIEMEQGG